MGMSFEQVQSDPRWGSHDRPRKAEAIWHTLLHHCGPDISDSVWVDVGCGSGGIAATLAPRVKRMVGIDPEPWPRWKDWIREHSNLAFIQGSYEDEPPLIDPSSVDIVICNQVYEHVPDPVVLTRFIHLILKPGGYCYFAGPNLLFPIEPHVFWPFVHWFPREFAVKLMRACGAKQVMDAFSTHYWRLLRWFRETGFETENALPTRLYLLGEGANRRVLSACLAACPVTVLHALTPLSPAFIFVLRKPGVAPSQYSKLIRSEERVP